MKIKLTLKDYLRQLQLMNKQYAQEEAFRHSGAKDDVYHGRWPRESEYIKGL